MITRIRELLEARQLSPTQFADLIGVGRPVISHILSERNKPSLEVVQKIIGAFPDISLPWLLAGTGSMLADEVTPPTISTPNAAEAVSAPTIPAAPPVTVPSPASPITYPAAPARPQSATQPSNYPQPPRFRPTVAAPVASASPEVAQSSRSQANDGSLPAAPANAEASSPLVVASAAPTATMASSLPGSNPLPISVIAPSPADPALATTTQSPAPPLPVTSTVPTTLGSSFTSPVTETPAAPVSSEAPAPSSNPAAALSFLGEPGKAIRRIVIFYRDGSFSDYLPEGS